MLGLEWTYEIKMLWLYNLVSYRYCSTSIHVQCNILDTPSEIFLQFGLMKISDHFKLCFKTSGLKYKTE